MDEIQKLAEVIGKMLGADTAEIIRIPEGQTIEDVIKARGLVKDPEGEVCESCGVTHAYVKAEDLEKPKGKEDQQVRAVASLNKRIAQVQEGIFKLIKLRDSIATPVAEREDLQTLDEMVLAMELKKIGVL